MKLNKAKELMDKLDLIIKNLKIERVNINLKKIVDVDLYIPSKCCFFNDDDFKKFTYISGQIDLFLKLRDLIQDTYFDETEDLSYIKESYPDTYINFIDGHIDSLFSLKDIL